MSQSSDSTDQATPAVDPSPASSLVEDERWTVHTPDSWARAIVAFGVRQLQSDFGGNIKDMPNVLRVRRLDGGGLQVTMRMGQEGEGEQFHLALGS
jgi:hypothetical protein